MNASLAKLGAKQLPDPGYARSLTESARKAQQRWAEVPVKARLRTLRQFRFLLADQSAAFIAPIQAVRGVTPAEVLVSEIVPLADACRFLERRAGSILAPSNPKSGRPLWLAGSTLSIHREALGVVLIVGPSNYPLFIVGVQVLQALAAGNAVIVKPGRDAGEAIRILRDTLVAAGLDHHLIALIDDRDESTVSALIKTGLDKLLLTGSSRTGAALMESAASSLTPSTMELSGCDAAFVLQGTDTALAAKALAFGLSLNRSRTCMRPHRLLVHASLKEDLVSRLAGEFRQLNSELGPLGPDAVRMIASALREGAKVLAGDAESGGGLPIILEGVSPQSELAQTDSFAPVLVLHSFFSIDDAIGIYDHSRYALGASVFGPQAEAERLAHRINAGFIVINDVIAPTADPRLPFSGRKQSGFGVTRGAEGLLELTRVKAISTRHSNYRHLEPRQPEDAGFFLSYLHMAHGAGLRRQITGAINLFRSGMSRAKAKRGKTS